MKDKRIASTSLVKFVHGQVFELTITNAAYFYIDVTKGKKMNSYQQFLHNYNRVLNSRVKNCCAPQGTNPGSAMLQYVL